MTILTANALQPLKKIDPEREKVFFDFLNGDRSTRIYNFVYQDDVNEADTAAKAGVESWDSALAQGDENNKYYVYPNEVELISRIAAEVAQAVSYRPLLVELGIGSPKPVVNKTIPLIQALKPQRFVANDLSRKAVNGAQTLIGAAFPWLDVKTCQADFLAAESDIYKYTDANVMLLGNTIANIMAYDGHTPVNGVVAYLRSVARLLGEKGSLIVTQDTCHDEQTVRESWGTPALVQFCKDVFYRMRAFEGMDTLDVSLLRFEGVWDERARLYTGAFVNEAEQTLRLNGREVRLEAGQRLYVLNSYKYTVSAFHHMARIAGLEPVRTWKDAQGRVALHVLRRA